MKNKGFTLIELLVVISIISLLSTVVVQQLNSARSKAKIAKFTSEILQFQKAIQLYASDHNGDYPLSDSNDYLANDGYDWAADSNVGLISSLNTYLSPYIKLSNSMFDVSGVVQSSMSISISCIAPGCVSVSMPVPVITSIYYIVGENSEKIFEWWTGDIKQSPDDGLYCGDVMINKYLILIYTDSFGNQFDLGLSLPKVKYIYNGQSYQEISYCVGE